MKTTTKRIAFRRHDRPNLPAYFTASARGYSAELAPTRREAFPENFWLVTIWRDGMGQHSGQKVFHAADPDKAKARAREFFAERALWLDEKGKLPRNAQRVEAYAQRKHANPAARFSTWEVDFSVVALDFIEDGRRERIGTYTTESEARDTVKRIIDRAYSLHTPDSPPLKTKRGTFPIRHIRRAAADAEGLAVWFLDSGFYILRNGKNAFAVPHEIYDPSIETWLDAGRKTV